MSLVYARSFDNVHAVQLELIEFSLLLLITFQNRYLLCGVTTLACKAYFPLRLIWREPKFIISFKGARFWRELALP